MSTLDKLIHVNSTLNTGYKGEVFLSLDLETAGLAGPVKVDNEYVDGARYYSLFEIAGVLLDKDFNELGRFRIPLEQEGKANLDTLLFHHKNGYLEVWDEVSKTLVSTAEQEILEFLSTVLNNGLPLTDYSYKQDVKIVIVGKSVWFDRAFLTHRMPELISKMSHQMIDVSTLKPLLRLAHPKVKTIGNLQSTHFALDDCESAISDVKVILKLIRSVSYTEGVLTLEDLLTNK